MSNKDALKSQYSKENISLLASKAKDLINYNKSLKNLILFYKDSSESRKTQITELLVKVKNNNNEMNIKLFKSILESSIEKISKYNNTLKTNISNSSEKYENALQKQLLPNIENIQKLLHKLREDNFLISNELKKKESQLTDLLKSKKNIDSYGIIFEENTYTYDEDEGLIDDVMNMELEDNQRRLAKMLHDTNERAIKLRKLKKLSRNLKEKIGIDLKKNTRRISPKCNINIRNFHEIENKYANKNKNKLEKNKEDKPNSERNNDNIKNEILPNIETYNEDDFLFNEFEDFSGDEYDLVSHRHQVVQTEYTLPSLKINNIGEQKITYNLTTNDEHIDKSDKDKNLHINPHMKTVNKPIPKLNLKQIEFNKTKIFLKVDSARGSDKDEHKFSISDEKKNTIEFQIEKLIYDIREIKQEIKKNLKIISNFKIFYKWKKNEIIKILGLNTENNYDNFFNGIVVTEVK